MINMDVKPRILQIGTIVGKISNFEEIQEIQSPNKVDEFKGKMYGPLLVDTVNLNNEQKQQFTALLQKYQKVFAKHEFDIGTSNIIKHKIKLTNPSPIKQRPYKIPHTLRDECNRQVDQWLKQVLHNIVNRHGYPLCC